jgi:5'-3' exonuclease
MILSLAKLALPKAHLCWPPATAQMCILAGCDYLPSMPGIGIKTAFSLVQRAKSLNQVRFFETQFAA